MDIPQQQQTCTAAAAAAASAVICMICDATLQLKQQKLRVGREPAYELTATVRADSSSLITISVGWRTALRGLDGWILYGYPSCLAEDCACRDSAPSSRFVATRLALRRGETLAEERTCCYVLLVMMCHRDMLLRGSW